MSPKQRKSLKKLSKFFQVAISTVQNVINKYRLRASVEAKKGPGKTFLLKLHACLLGKQTSIKP